METSPIRIYVVLVKVNYRCQVIKCNTKVFERVQSGFQITYQLQVLWRVKLLCASLMCLRYRILKTLKNPSTATFMYKVMREYQQELLRKDGFKEEERNLLFFYQYVHIVFNIDNTIESYVATH